MTYITELDYNMGDIIVSFPNPDFPEMESIEELEPLEALEFCKAAFCSKKSSSDWETIDNLIFMKAIEQVYFLLMKKDKFEKLEKKKRKKKKVEENEQLEGIEE